MPERDGATPQAPQRPPLSPPRIDLWPIAQQFAELRRGSILRCGPGFRSVGWPETPRVRLTALAPWLLEHRIAVRLTAAWVWGAAATPGSPVQVSTRVGPRGSIARTDDIDVLELRLDPADLQHFGSFTVTTPMRTILDLLYAPAEFGVRERAASRLLILNSPDCVHEVHDYVISHRRPGRRRAMSRLESLATS